MTLWEALNAPWCRQCCGFATNQCHITPDKVRPGLWSRSGCEWVRPEVLHPVATSAWPWEPHDVTVHDPEAATYWLGHVFETARRFWIEQNDDGLEEELIAVLEGSDTDLKERVVIACHRYADAREQKEQADG